VNLVQGTIIDTGLTFNFSTINKWRGKMGQAFGYMPDVSGYDVFKLWGDTQLSEAHKYLLSATGCRKQRRGKKTVTRCGQRNTISAKWKSGYYQKFSSVKKFEVAFEELADETADTYSYVKSRCDMSLFLVESGKEEITITEDQLFGLKQKNKKKLSLMRLNKFYSLLKTNADNVCMFLA